MGHAGNNNRRTGGRTEQSAEVRLTEERGGWLVRGRGHGLVLRLIPRHGVVGVERMHAH